MLVVSLLNFGSVGGGSGFRYYPVLKSRVVTVGIRARFAKRNEILDMFRLSRMSVQ